MLTFELIDKAGAVFFASAGEPHGTGQRLEICPAISAAAWWVRFRNSDGTYVELPLRPEAEHIGTLMGATQ